MGGAAVRCSEGGLRRCLSNAEKTVGMIIFSCFVLMSVTSSPRWLHRGRDAQSCHQGAKCSNTSRPKPSCAR